MFTHGICFEGDQAQRARLRLKAIGGKSKDKTPKRPSQRAGQACLGVLPQHITTNRLLQYGILESLRRTQTHNSLGLNLDRFAGGGVAAHARLAVRFHGASDSGDYELAGTLSFLY